MFACNYEDESVVFGQRCVDEVNRRHSIDVEGDIISNCISELRTPRPDIQEHQNNNKVDHVESRSFLFLLCNV